MKKQKKPKQKSRAPKAIFTARPQPETLPKRLWATLVAVVAAISAFLGFANWSYDQYTKLTPTIAPKATDSSSRSPPPFIIKNISSYFGMEDVELICGIDNAQFQTPDGRSVGFGMPVTSGRDNGPLYPTNSAEFRCDPSAFMKVENGELSLMGLKTTSFNASGSSDLKLIGATVWIGVKRKTLGIRFESVSSTWELKRAGDVFDWQEVRPNFR